MNTQKLPAPRVNYPSAQYQQMAEDFIHNGKLSISDVPELVKWRRHLRDLRHILMGAKTEKGVTRTIPNPSYGICRNLRLLRKNEGELCSAFVIANIAKVWPVYQELFLEGYVSSPLFPIPEFPKIDLWGGKALRYRLSLISFSIKLLSAAINQLNGKTTCATTTGVTQ
jgi:hypothetical protein